MFSTIFCAVPAFKRVEPVRTSGPTSGAIKIFASRATGMLRLAVTATVVALRLRACFNAPRTYGVEPLAATPTTTSFCVNRFALKSVRRFLLNLPHPRPHWSLRVFRPQSKPAPACETYQRWARIPPHPAPPADRSSPRDIEKPAAISHSDYNCFHRARNRENFLRHSRGYFAVLSVHQPNNFFR